eukprot:TRINITY_DN5519_c1_g1_i1.p3 TRINITY_DN5519_c1_g1~~TRINITY_DN5519_c1_g1_i1.p3  ORF type:complete len:111 (-),score=4.23 TRINITY_DN5519_c1_g1_i1:115-447(-)
MLQFLVPDKVQQFKADASLRYRLPVQLLAKDINQRILYPDMTRINRKQQQRMFETWAPLWSNQFFVKEQILVFILVCLINCKLFQLYNKASSLRDEAGSKLLMVQVDGLA